ncbi:MAG TPA: hypothetical protein VNM16_11545 [Bacillota bacterium]|nr:hypothetical protein [Bacillota bacterium]
MITAAILEIFLGIGALAGGLGLILAPDGSGFGFSTALLAGSPFTSFLVPGIILFTVLGIGPLVAAVLTLRRSPAAPTLALVVGILLVGWIVVEMVIMAHLGGVLWAFYLLLGVAIAAQSQVISRCSQRPTKR